MQKIRRHLLFYGNVQGVGFRFRACYSAKNLGVTGWVRNLDDGSVEMEAEGYPRDIDALVQSLEENRWCFIERLECTEIPVLNDYNFEILG